jgi:hypothetical protein
VLFCLANYSQISTFKKGQPPLQRGQKGLGFFFDQEALDVHYMTGQKVTTTPP